MKLTGITFAPDARAALQNHPWPGNVRELDNAVQRALVLHQGNVIHEGDLCLELGITGRVDGRPGMAMGQALSAPVSVSTPVEHDIQAGGQNEVVAPRAEESASLGDDLRQREFRIIIDTLRNARGRRNKAAEQLGISPRTLRYKLAQMRDAGIDLDAELAAA
jgi:two-component system response regulator FlrC